MQIKLDALSYKHRFAASNQLSSKANALRESAETDPEGRKKNRRTIVPFDARCALVDVDALGAALAYYDMALLLMKSKDPNYATVANWKCNVLLTLGQYADACAWYAEILKVTLEAEGPSAPLSPTAELAKKQLAKYRGKKNEPVAYRGSDIRDFDDPPFCMYAADFVRALAASKFAEAERHVEPTKAKEYSTGRLKTRWKSLVGDVGVEALSISLESHLFEWTGRKAREVGWCYFAVRGDGVDEGVAITVSHDKESTGIAISHVEFGRP
jgi:hypothetical protein